MTAEDRVLRYVHDHAIAHPKDIEAMGIDCLTALGRLMDDGFLMNVPSRVHSVMLTRKGMDAYEYGFDEYLDRNKKERQRNERNQLLKDIGVAVVSATISAILTFLSTT